MISPFRPLSLRAGIVSALSLSRVFVGVAWGWGETRAEQQVVIVSHELSVSYNHRGRHIYQNLEFAQSLA